MTLPGSWRPTLRDLLACPSDHSQLDYCGDALVCAQGHRFEIEQGIPIFAKSPRVEAVPGNMAPCKPPAGDATFIDPFVNDWIVNTNGNLYWPVRGKLPRYPIPEWPFLPGQGQRLVDIGCGWGRWSASAAWAGYQPIGVDVHVDALVAAVRVSRQLEVQADFVCGDVDRLPFHSKSIDVIFSYSVLQHLERSTVLGFFTEASRVLRLGGTCLIQLPNRFGAANIWKQMRRGFRDAKSGTFEMRYWSKAEICRGFRDAGMATPRIRTDGFLSQNARASDVDLLSPAGKLVVLASEAGRRASEGLPFLTNVADSLWIESRKENAPGF